MTTYRTDFMDGERSGKCLLSYSVPIREANSASALLPFLSDHSSNSYPCNLCNPWFAFLFFLLSVVFPLKAQEVEKIVLPPAKDMTRADLYVWSPVRRPEAVLVLTPGTNGNGEGMIRQREWQDFAREHKLALIGVSFASPDAILHENRGYYYAALGSGELLLKGVRKAFGRELPIILFGFSAGAHFSSRFVEWKPERVITWCAYSAGWWDEPAEAKLTPPGIVACGEEDGRLGASLVYFKQGRALGRPWLWVELPKTGHSCPPAMTSFARDYFAAILKGRGRLDPKKDGQWVDVDRRERISDGSEHPTVMAWLPDTKLYDEWRNLNTP